jgi:tetratricopeptide (TPR) repeat protein
VGGAFALYAPTLDHPYLIDDLRIIAENPTVTRPTLSGLLRLWTVGYWTALDPSGHAYPLGDDANLYRPVTILSFWGEGWLAHGPRGRRGANVLLHALAALLTGLWARTWLGDRGGVIASAFVLLHPVGTDVVNRLVGRADILALAGMSGFLVTQRLAQHAGWTWRRSATAGACVLVALGAKEAGVIVVPLATLQAWLRRREIQRGAAPPAAVARSTAGPWRGALAIGAAIAAYGVGRLVALGPWAAGLGVPSYPPDPRFDLLGNPLAGTVLGDRLPSIAALALYYLRVLLAPWPLTAFDVPPQLPAWSEPIGLPGLGWLPAATGLVVLATVLGGGTWLGARGHPLVLAAGWWLCSFLVVGQIVAPIGVFAETRLAYPMLGGAALVTGWLGTRVRRRGGALALLLAAGASVAAAAAVVSRSRDFRSELALHEAEASYKPGDPVALLRLGQVHREMGAEAADHTTRRAHLHGAKQAFARVVRQVPRSAQAWYGLAELYDTAADIMAEPDRTAEQRARAERLYLHAVALRPRHAAALHRLAVNALEAGDLPTARRHLTAALAIEPGDPALRTALVRLEAREGRWGAALDRLATLAREVPQEPYLTRLHAEYLAVEAAGRRAAHGDREAAIGLVEAVLRDAPENETAWTLLHDWVLGPEAGRVRDGRYEPAIERFETFLRAHPGHTATARLFDGYVVAHAQRERLAGRANEARRWLRETLARHPGLSEARRLLEELEGRSGDR